MEATSAASAPAHSLMGRVGGRQALQQANLHMQLKKTARPVLMSGTPKLKPRSFENGMGIPMRI